MCTWVPQRHQSLGFLPHLVCPPIWLLERQGEGLYSKTGIISSNIKMLSYSQQRTELNPFLYLIAPEMYSYYAHIS